MLRTPIVAKSVRLMPAYHYTFLITVTTKKCPCLVMLRKSILQITKISQMACTLRTWILQMTNFNEFVLIIRRRNTLIIALNTIEMSQQLSNDVIKKYLHNPSGRYHLFSNFVSI